MASSLRLPSLEGSLLSLGCKVSQCGQRAHPPPSPSCSLSNCRFSSVNGSFLNTLHSGNGDLLFRADIQQWKGKGMRRQVTRSEEEKTEGEKPRRRRAAPRGKELEGGEAPAKKPTRGRRKQADEGGGETVTPKRTTRKKAEAESGAEGSGTTRRRRKKADEEPSISSKGAEGIISGQQDNMSGQQDTNESPSSSTEGAERIISGQQEIIDKQQEIISKQQEIISEQQSERGGNGAAVRREGSENGSGKLVVGEVVEDSKSMDVLGDEEELRRIAQKVSPLICRVCQWFHPKVSTLR